MSNKERLLSLISKLDIPAEPFYCEEEDDGVHAIWNRYVLQMTLVNNSVVCTKKPGAVAIFNIDDIYTIREFVQIPMDVELKMLWDHSYYDGPLSGVALYNGEQVWFTVHHYGVYQDVYCGNLDLSDVYDLPKDDLQMIKEYIASDCYNTDAIRITDDLRFFIELDGEEYIITKIPEIVRDYLREHAFEILEKSCIRVGHYEIEFDWENRVGSIYEHRTYKLYRLPADILTQLTAQHNRFQECVGYNSDHDPKLRVLGIHYRKYDEYYSSKIEPVDMKCDEYEYLGEFARDEFQKWENEK